MERAIVFGFFFPRTVSPIHLVNNDARGSINIDVRTIPSEEDVNMIILPHFKTRSFETLVKSYYFLHITPEAEEIPKRIFGLRIASTCFSITTYDAKNSSYTVRSRVSGVVFSSSTSSGEQTNTRNLNTSPSVTCGAVPIRMCSRRPGFSTGCETLRRQFGSDVRPPQPSDSTRRIQACARPR